MTQEIADIPVVSVDDTVETVRNWSDGKAFQVAVHAIRDNLTQAEAGIALSNIAEASIAAVLTAVEEDFAARRSAGAGGGLAVAVLGDLASREAAFGTPIDILCVHDGGEAAHYESLCREFADALRALSEGSLLFPPVPPGQRIRPVRSLDAFGEHHRTRGIADELLELTRARGIFACGDAEVAARFDAARRAVLADGAVRGTLVAELRKPAGAAPKPGIASIGDMRGGHRDIERAARLLQLAHGADDPEDPALTATAILETAGKAGTVSPGRGGTDGRGRPALAEPAGRARPRGLRRRGGQNGGEAGRRLRCAVLRDGRYGCAGREDRGGRQPGGRGYRCAGGRERGLGRRGRLRPFPSSRTRAALLSLPTVMPGLVPGIHVLRHRGAGRARARRRRDVDARNKSGHDAVGESGATAGTATGGAACRNPGPGPHDPSETRSYANLTDSPQKSNRTAVEQVRA